jgi:hypothetical protein
MKTNGMNNKYKYLVTLFTFRVSNAIMFIRCRRLPLPALQFVAIARHYYASLLLTMNQRGCTLNTIQLRCRGLSENG